MRANQRRVRAPLADEQRGHARIGEIERRGEARRLALVGRDERCALDRIIEPNDAVDDRIFGRQLGQPSMPCLMSRSSARSIEATSQVSSCWFGQRSESTSGTNIVAQARERRSSSTFTSAGCVTA